MGAGWTRYYHKKMLLQASFDIKHRRITAVKKNDVSALIRLADTSEWYKYVHPKTGNTLLHFAVWKEREPFNCNKDVFHYLLSFSDFPVNHRNKQGFTVVDFILSNLRRRDHAVLDDFAYELMKKGCSAKFVPLEPGETLLHFAIRNQLVQVSKLMIQMGYDVNAQYTPIWLCLRSDMSQKDKAEIVAALLCRGANPRVGQREYYGSTLFSSRPLQEALFHSMIDDYTSVDLNFHTLLLFAKNRSPLFHDIIDYVDNVILEDKFSLSIECFFDIDSNNFDVIFKKYSEEIVIAFSKTKQIFNHNYYIRENMVLKNINLLLESALRDDTIDLMCRFNNEFIRYSLDDTDDSAALQHLYFFLSYGVGFNEYYLKTIYDRFGFDEFIKIVLHHEIQFSMQYDRDAFLYDMGAFSNDGDAFLNYRDAFLFMIYNVRCDLRHIFENPWQYCLNNISELLTYFSNATLRAWCSIDRRPEVATLIANQPRVPLLAELSRNVYRSFLIQTFQITHVRHLYSLVNKLPIATLHKKILTFEMKLY